MPSAFGLRIHTFPDTDGNAPTGAVRKTRDIAGMSSLSACPLCRPLLLPRVPGESASRSGPPSAALESSLGPSHPERAWSRAGWRIDRSVTGGSSSKNARAGTGGGKVCNEEPTYDLYDYGYDGRSLRS